MVAFDSKLFAASNWLRCINPECGHETPLLQERKFICPDCGDIYDVIHSQTKPFPINLMTLRDRFTPDTPGFKKLNGSGVWAFKELILPGVPSENLVSLGERISLVKIVGKLAQWIGGNLDLYMAMEGVSPTGSFKDLGMSVAITTAKLSGAPLVACASTGDTSAAAAAYAAAAGIPCAVILPKNKITDTQLVQPFAHGAKIFEVDGDFDDCMRILRDLVEHHGVFPVNSLNPARIEGHQATVFNTWFQLGGELPDWFVVPLGNGSNTSSIGKGQDAIVTAVDTELSVAKILSVQPENAAPLADSFVASGGWQRGTPDDWLSCYKPIKAGKTIATAASIGNPVSFKKVMRAIDFCGGGITSVNDKMAREAMFAAGASGHMVCPQTGLALAGLKEAVEHGHVEFGSRVVVVSTAHGLKFADNFRPQDGEPFTTSLDTPTTAEAASILGLS